MRRSLAFCLISVVMSVAVWAESNPPLALSFNLTPYAALPLGDDAKTFSLGGGSQASVDYLFPRVPGLSVGLVGDYLFLPTADPALSLSVASGGAQAGLRLKVLPVLDLQLGASGGQYYALTNTKPSSATATSSGTNPWFAAGLGLGFNLSEYFSLNLAGAYHNDLGLFTGATFSVSANLTPEGNKPFINDATLPPGFLVLPKEKRGLKLLGIQSSPIFPVFKNYYDDHPVAQVVLHNYENADATDIQVTAEIKDYMNGPRDLKVPARLGSGGTEVVDVYTLFNDRILNVSEATKLGLTLTVKYTQNGSPVTETYAPTVDVLYRNAITWDDDRHVGAFISSRDPAAYGYIRGVVSSIRDTRNHALSLNLQVAMALHEALKRHGIIYSKVPTSAFNRGDKVAVDTVQFPQETLQSKTGDCSDLTVLWCSMLESVGVETAAITTPGHIYMAFALDVSPEQATAILGSADKFLLRNGKAWVPVETTMITDSFLQAWQEGARESNPALQPNLAFYPIHEAWKLYAPVVVSGAVSSPALPPPSVLNDALMTEVQGLIKTELEPRAAKLQADAKVVTNPAKVTNSLGLLYARYGQYDRASKVLSDLISKQQFGPAFVNLGNINLLQKKYQDALEVFNRWLNINPDDGPALAGQALAYDGLGDRTNTAASFDRLSALDPKLASRYQYLKADTATGGARAAEANSLESVLAWKE